MPGRRIRHRNPACRRKARRIVHLRLAAAVALALAAPVAAQEAIDLIGLGHAEGFVIRGAVAGDFSGAAVSAAGDVNGDGLGDIVVGAPEAERNATIFAGEGYVVFGRADGVSGPVELASLDGSNGFAVIKSGSGDSSQLGFSVDGGGDINGDGIDDIVIGAPGGNFFAGETYVVFGSDQGFSPTIDVSTLDGTNGFRIDAASSGDSAGSAVSIRGDVNGDGIDDVLVSAPGGDPGGTSSAGETYVVFGSDQGFSAVVDLGALTGADGFVLNGVAQDDFSGLSAAISDDLNGDGVDDLIIGAERADPDGKDRAGETYVVFGFDNPSISGIDLSGLDGGNGFVVNGIAPLDFAGGAVAGAGDVNGDGLADLLIGARVVDRAGFSFAGEAYLIFGTRLGFPAAIELSALNGVDGFVLEGAAADDRTGYDVSSAGDVNGDGFDDLLIGAPRAAAGGDYQSGITYLVFGTDKGFAASVQLPGLAGNDGLALLGADVSDLAGQSVSGTGDVNGDGIDDLLVGAPGGDPAGRGGAGETHVIFGDGAPLALGDTAVLPSAMEDTPEPAGSRLDFTVAAHYLDTDPFRGLAVVGNASSTAEGSWEYSNDGNTWLPVVASPSDAAALVLEATALLRFVPAPDFFGRPGALTVRLWDGRWRQPGENVDIVDAIGALGGFSADADLLDVVLEIIPVNDAPSFTAANPPVVNEDPGGVTVTGWAGFDPGAVNESAQVALAWQVAAVSNPTLFSIPPTVDFDGNLVYRPAPDTSGTSTFDVRVVDSGGTDNGGINVSDRQTFTITVQAVNDAPMLIAEDPPPVFEDAGAQRVDGWAQFDPGAFDENDQTPTYEVVDVADSMLFDQLPTVDAQGDLVYTPASGVVGEAEFTVVVNDGGGTANGGVETSAPTAFTIRVLDDDVVFVDSFESE